MTEQDEAVRAALMAHADRFSDLIEQGVQPIDAHHQSLQEVLATPPPAGPHRDYVGRTCTTGLLHPASHATPPPAAPAAPALDPVREHFEEWGVHMCDSAHLPPAAPALDVDLMERIVRLKGLIEHELAMVGDQPSAFDDGAAAAYNCVLSEWPDARLTGQQEASS